LSLVVYNELMITRAWFYLLGGLLFAGSAQVWCSIEETLGRDFIPQATPRSVPMPQIDLAKVPGTYDHWGTRLTLNSDGSYAAIWSARCGNAGHGKVIGNWHVSGRTVALSPTSETGMTEPIPKELKIFEWGESDVVLVPGHRRFLNLTGLRISECFLNLDRLRALRERVK
jgi:hypothetical protein